MASRPRDSWIQPLIRFCLQNRMIVLLVTLILIGWGLVVAPFDWHMGKWLRDPVPVDAIPDIGENQQIVFTEWSGRSPQDVEDQITYPLSVSLLGIPGVKTIRTYSMFGFSLIYVIFEDGVDFYWSRTRVLEKLNSLPSRELPLDVKPTLGPDATALGQVFWYTLEGRSPEGKPTGGWDLHELRTLQDWYVRYSLMSVPGVSEVASIGGFVQEYQIDVDPDRLRYRGVRLEEVVEAVRRANVDVGARTIEVNKVEYVIRGLGFIKSIDHIKDTIIKLVDETPILVDHVANVILGPASRRGALDKNGREAVGGVVVVRFGENPLAVIQQVHKKIEEISLGLPKRTLSDGTLSQIGIVPFYDRTGLIHETLGTLSTALSYQMLVAAIVVLVMMAHLRSSVLVTGLLPLSVLICFIAMKVFKVDANVVALTGIAIAIGTMVDMGIIITENILRHRESAAPGVGSSEIILRATREIGSAVLTAVATTIISFMPVFAMEGAEGKLFKPLAFTKTFALFASMAVALVIIPAAAHFLLGRNRRRWEYHWLIYESLIYLGAVLIFILDWRLGLIVAGIGTYRLLGRWYSVLSDPRANYLIIALTALGATFFLADQWMPLGFERGLFQNFVFIVLVLGGVLLSFRIFHYYYEQILGWCLSHKALFLMIPLLLVIAGGLVWRGYENLFGWMPRLINESGPGRVLARSFPGLGREFMPPLDEGAYLFMPTTMPHASIGEVLDILQRQDIAIQAIPEVESVVGKLGRAETALDPAPVSMIETLITYRPEYLTGENGKPRRFRFQAEQVDVFRDFKGNPLPAADGEPYYVQGRFVRDEDNRLIPDPDGTPFRLWRPALDHRLNPERQPWKGIQRPDDIWSAIIRAGSILGTTTAPRLQPISARMVMLQSGIRANMGVKVYGPDLVSIEDVTRQIEKILRSVPSVDPATVIADRIIGKPYIEIEINRRAIAQYGIDLQQVQDVIEIAIGGKQISTTVQGRERYPVRVRYLRELRDDINTIGEVLVTSRDGRSVPLVQLADIRYVPGPQVIKGENTFQVGYVLFDGRDGFAETNTVEQASDYLMQSLRFGELDLPKGVSFSFTGNYENQVRADKKLKLILPLALMIIFIILYLQFKSIIVSGLVFSGIAVAWAGGFVMLWLYGQPWFLDFSIFDTSMRDLFQVHPINLSVATWVGFLALFGIASDDGVVMTTYLNDTFRRRNPGNLSEIRRAIIDASRRRVRPCLMTTATTILALVPVLTSTGRGSDIMVPMAIPSFGGMVFEVITMLVIPVLYCWLKETNIGGFLKNQGEKNGL